MKRFNRKAFASIAVAALLSTSSISASGAPDDFDSFMKDALSDFNDFLDKANRDFIDFMRKPWEKHQAKKPTEARPVPEPVKPTVFDPVSTPPEEQKPTELTIQEILDLTTKENEQKPVVKVDVPQGETIPVDKPQPVKPQKPAKPKTPTKPATPTKPEVPTAPAKPATPTKPATPKRTEELYSGGSGRTQFVYGGIPYYINNGIRNGSRLNSLDENALADAYESLFRTEWQPVVNDLKQLRQSGLNNDWALFMFIKQVAEAYAGGKNESVVMRQFLLNQMGFKARMAYIPAEKRLTLLVAPDTPLYGVVQMNLGGMLFYDVDAREPYSFRVCGKDSPASKKQVSMQLPAFPDFKGERKSSTHTSIGGQPTVTASVPSRLADFYMQMPQCDYRVYAQAHVDPEFSNALLNSLRPAVAGKSEREAANILLSFVQNGFKYATDDEQFGFEKPFFVEELFYYPYCDCEDRSILYRYLVKNLLGLDIVLVSYPNHIATAVKFNEPVNGDYLNVNGQKYVVCDPTYIGAPVGLAMPNFKNVQGKVLRY